MANDDHVDVVTAGEAVRTPTISAGLQGVNAPKLHLQNATSIFCEAVM